MAIEPVRTPNLLSEISVVVDWLELIAFFNEFSTARLDVLEAALEEQEDFQEDDIGRKDQLTERLRESIENEFDFRAKHCGGGYPFNLSDDAEELLIVENWMSEEYCFYLTCLLTSHLTTNSLFDFTVCKEIELRLRNRVFQVLSTFAMAGLAGGSAASIGWPRENSNTVLETVSRAAKRGAGITPRNKVGRYTPPGEKDGGIDVIAWSKEDRPPPTLFYFAQAASGHNWKGKPVSTHVLSFEANYIDQIHAGDKSFATLIPFRETEITAWMQQSSMHGTLIDRTRLPKYANIGLAFVQAGGQMDESENIPQVVDWICQLREFGLQS